MRLIVSNYYLRWRMLLMAMAIPLQTVPFWLLLYWSPNWLTYRTLISNFDCCASLHIHLRKHFLVKRWYGAGGAKLDGLWLLDTRMQRVLRFTRLQRMLLHTRLQRMLRLICHFSVVIQGHLIGSTVPAAAERVRRLNKAFCQIFFIFIIFQFQLQFVF